MTDPLHAAIGAALHPHGITNPDVITAAAEAAAMILGRDRCTHERRIHAQHHHTTVDDCPWCMTSSPADRTPAPAVAVAVAAKGDLL
ncbi:hypothetical protein ACWCPF_26070 [Streptomyces sp. NPDC001858]